MTENNTPLLEARNLTKIFDAPGGSFLNPRHIAAVDDVSLTMPKKPTILNLVGESGSGKTTLARMLLGLAPPTSGEVYYNGKNIYKMNKSEWQVYRREVQAVFQDPYGIYNPFYKIERVLEMIIQKFKLASSQTEGRKLMEDALRAVDLRPNDIIGRYPHQLSGGERQRVMLARLYLMKPRLIIADEPVSMIDAAVRTLFMNILLDFRDNLGISCIFITHNLSTAYYLGGEMMVLNFGRAVEVGDLDLIMKSPSHPYTKQLLESVPSGDPENRWEKSIKMENTERPMLVQGRNQCLYAARCPFTMEVCLQHRPPQFKVNEHQSAACFLHGQPSDDPNASREPVGAATGEKVIDAVE